MLQQLLGSLFRPDFYLAALREPVGRAVRYFLLLSLILGTLMGFKVIFWVTSGVNQVVETFNDSFPDFVIEQGRLKADAKMPYVVIKSDADGIVIVDTTGQTDMTALQPYKSGVLFTADAMINKKSEGDIQISEFKRLSDVRLTKADVAQWLPWLKWISLVALLVGLAYYFAAQALSAVIVTMMTFILAWIMKRRLNYAQACRLSLYALTASCILDAFKFIADLPIAGYGILYYGLPLLYVAGALRRIEPPTEKE